MHTRIILLLALVALLLAGCARDPLDGTAWQLTSLRGQPPLPNTFLLLQFIDGELRGEAGCNLFGSPSTYSLTGSGGLEFEIISATVMQCVDENGDPLEAVMEQERDYIDTLIQVRGYRIDGDQLELLDDQEDPLLTYQRAELPGD
jgi:heat shock protein HslJ